MRACRAWHRAWLAGVAVLASTPAVAQEQNTAGARLSLEVGMGHESQTSPLVQISPDSTLIYLGGLQRLQGSHVRTAMQGGAEWTLPMGMGVTVNGDVTIKRSPRTPDLDTSSASAQPSLHLPLPGSSLGVGVNVQRMTVAGQHFRDTTSLQASWTLFSEGNLWSVFAEDGNYRHRGALTELDARARSLVAQWQRASPLPGVDTIDISAVVGRERNAQGYRELSQRSAMFNASVQWTWLGASWSAGSSWRQARFDDTAFADEPVRKDRTALLDLAVAWPLSPQVSMRVEFNGVRNASTTRLYDNQYRQIGVALRTIL